MLAAELEVEAGASLSVEKGLELEVLLAAELEVEAGASLWVEQGLELDVLLAMAAGLGSFSPGGAAAGIPFSGSLAGCAPLCSVLSAAVACPLRLFCESFSA